MSKIHPFLWYDTEAEEAMNLYTSIFPNSKKGTVSRYPDAMPGMGGKVMTAEFTLDGMPVTALNAGPQFKFTEAFSMYVETKDQAETDRYWNALIADGGEASQCGWLKDKFGLSWQIIPEALPRLMGDKDRQKADRVMAAMLKMQKIVVADLEKAYAG
jgi:predicted 3-demethylubiquinone-9 3-methyltransferase (glyoxalase superfamily)